MSQNLTDLSHLCKAAGDPLRLKILRLLQDSSFGVQELAFIFEMPQPGISHHLKVLSKAGLLASRREGNGVFYRRQDCFPDTPWLAAHSGILASLDEQPLDASSQQRLLEVHQQRAASSVSFFDRHAEDFMQAQGKIVDDTYYQKNIENLIEKLLPAAARKALEVGPGEASLLRYLADKVSFVMALDNSPGMLESAKSQIVKSGQNNVKFVLGEPRDLVAEHGKSFDLVVLNMVLHHSASPAAMIQALSELMQPSGILLLADLSKHEQEWVKESCGDLWLGFESTEILQWAKAAGLVELNSLFFGLKNGFQVQIKAFEKA